MRAEARVAAWSAIKVSCQRCCVSACAVATRSGRVLSFLDWVQRKGSVGTEEVSKVYGEFCIRAAPIDVISNELAWKVMALNC